MGNKKLETFKTRYKKIFGYITWAFVILLIISTVKNINKVISIRKQVETEKEKVEKMQADNAKLQAQIAEAEGSDFIDKQMHDKLGLAKGGETVVVLPEDSVVKSLAPVKTVDEDTLPDPNWMKWKKLFF